MKVSMRFPRLEQQPMKGIKSGREVNVVIVRAEELPDAGLARCAATDALCNHPKNFG